MAIGKSLVGTGLGSFGGLGSLGAASCGTAGARAFQTALNLAVPGANLAVDGVVGPLTIGAMQRYQRQAGLPITAQPNEQTLLNLGVGPAHHEGVMSSFSCFSGGGGIDDLLTLLSGGSGQSQGSIQQTPPILGGGITGQPNIAGGANQTPSTGISTSIGQTIGQILGGGPQVLGMSLVQWGMLGSLGVVAFVLVKKYSGKGKSK